MRVCWVVAATVAVLSLPSTAAATAWPFAGGDASRSGFAAPAAALPAPVAWSAPAPGGVRTPVVVTEGASPDAQRVAYGTGDGAVHVRSLTTGAEAGPPVVAADAPFTDPSSAFGPDGVAAAPVAAATQLYVVHDDGGGLEVLRADLATGARVTGDVPVPGSLGCVVAGSPLLTPTASDGSRLLFFTMRGPCSAGPGLVRWGVGPDGALLGAPTTARVAGVTLGASPALVVLRDGTGAPRFHVAVPADGGLTFFDAGRDLTDAPDLVAKLPVGERAQTPSAPATAAGLVSGGAGSGTPPAAAVYVAAVADGTTRVHRFVQDGTSRTLRDAGVGRLDGVPAPGLAVAETMTPSGPSPDGRLLVPTAAGVAVLRSADLTQVGFLGGAGAAEGAPVAAGRLGVVGRAGQDLLAVDLTTGMAAGAVRGTSGVTSQPALARGLLVAGTPDAIVALRTADASPPAVTLTAPRAIRRRQRMTVRVRAADDRGVGAVVVRLRGHRVGASKPAAFTDAIDVRLRVRAPRRAGRVRLTATATDGGGLRRTVRRSVRIRR